MMDFRERQRLRRVFYGKTMVLVLIFVLALIVRGSWGMYEKSVEAGQKRDKALGELKVLTTREEELSNDISHLSTERGIEEAIRTKFMVAKEGERVIIVNDSTDNAEVHRVFVPAPKPSTLDRLLGAVGIEGE